MHHVQSSVRHFFRYLGTCFNENTSESGDFCLKHNTHLYSRLRERFAIKNLNLCLFISVKLSFFITLRYGIVSYFLFICLMNNVLTKKMIYLLKINKIKFENININMKRKLMMCLYNSFVILKLIFLLMWFMFLHQFFEEALDILF